MNEDRKYNSREQQAIETRNKILDAAIKQFSKSGFHGTSIRDINKSIDVADGLLYHYFPGGKEELFKAISKDAIGQIEEDIQSRRQLYDSLPLDAVIESIYQYSNHIFETHHDKIKILLLEFWQHAATNSDDLAEIISKSERWFPKFLEKRALKGEIKEMDYEAATHTFIAIIMHHFIGQLIELPVNNLSNETTRKRVFKHILSTWKGI